MEDLMPAIAEVAFLGLARKWYEELQAIPVAEPIPESTDRLALSCLLLAVEWGQELPDLIREQIQKNREDAEARLRMTSWDTELSWKLCDIYSQTDDPSEDDEVLGLIANLNHKISSIRLWMMDIAWIARPWLDIDEAMPILLQDVAEMLAGPYQAAGLAAALVSTEDEFWSLAREFSPPTIFENQYRKRLKEVEEQGIQEMQAPFWKLEAQCRKIILQEVLDRKLPFPRGKK
jgi:hypothetical protein